MPLIGQGPPTLFYDTACSDFILDWYLWIWRAMLLWTESVLMYGNRKASSDAKRGVKPQESLLLETKGKQRFAVVGILAWTTRPFCTLLDRCGLLATGWELLSRTQILTNTVGSTLPSTFDLGPMLGWLSFLDAVCNITHRKVWWFLLGKKSSDVTSYSSLRSIAIGVLQKFSAKIFRAPLRISQRCVVKRGWGPNVATLQMV